ncbi:MAG TPA: zinc-dependent metalloprotease [Fimbriimonadaceae bacterium]|nr:zinc-dependent metalloprotease [Fimbriimonadaceae bacterium]HRJ33184.1 zinc-dependent metalloprotease [Fimbriimonadaceae bacterium]
MKTLRKGTAKAWAVLALVLAALPALAADKVLLQVKGKAGDVHRSEATMKLKTEFAGQAFELTMKSIGKTDVKSVDAQGNLTTESSIESMEQSMDGEKIEVDPGDYDGVTTMVVSPRGIVLSQKTTGQVEESGIAFERRLANAQTLIFSDKPVTVGDKWTYNYPEDPKTFSKQATANFELLAFEKIDGNDVAKIKLNFAETTGNPAFISESTAWARISDGLVVKIESKIDDIEMTEAGMTMKLSGNITGKLISSTSPNTNNNTTNQTPNTNQKTIDSEMKDWEKIPGQFTLYRKRESGRLQLRMEIPEAMLNQWVMLQATASTGNNQQFVAGNPISDLLFQFREMEPDKITIVVPNYWMRADPHEPVARAVQRSFASSFIETFRVELRQPERKSLLIDASDLFRGNISGVFDTMSGGGGLAAFGFGGGGYSPDREKTFISSIKNFPENLVVETTYSFNRTGGGGGGFGDLLSSGSVADPRNVVIRVNYNLFALPQSNYRPRFADPRVGYFTTDYTDFSRTTDIDLTRKVILRWNLQKKDPNAALSEPVKPIKFWLDNAIPTKFRTPIREAILSWNAAFEKAGFKNAVVVEQMPDEADFDHADMRFNVIRWVTSGNNAYAVALFRNNPITGEILNASITIDAGIVQFFNLEAKSIAQPGSAKAHKDPKNHVHEPGGACCMTEEIKEQAALGKLAGQMMRALQGMPFDEEAYVEQFVRWVTAHEFGHILGLRHNFIASTELDLKQLGDPELVRAAGTSASVMDYVPFNVSALGKKDVPYWTGLGKYDHWAIEFGYKDFGALSSAGEVAALRRHASANNSPGLAYQSDETADQWDPQVQRFDLSKHPMEYWARMMELTKKLLMNLDQRQPRNGQSFYEFTRDFYLLFGMHTRAANTAMMSIGGLNLNANWKGDPGEKPPLRPVPASEQRQALDLINRFVFGPEAVEIPKRMMTLFQSNPNAGMLESFLSGSDTNPILDAVSGFKSGMLRSLFSADVLSRVVNNEFKAARPAEAFRLIDLFNQTSEAIWSELKTGGTISAPRRQLQRAYISMMGDMITKPGDARPNDAKMLAWAWLKELQKRLEKVKVSTTDPYTPVHIQECLMRIEQILDAEITIGQPATGGGAPSLLDLLGGAKPPARAGGGR